LLAHDRTSQGSYEGLRAWGICRLVRVGGAKPAPAKGKGKGKAGSKEDDWERSEEATGKKGKARGGKEAGDKLGALAVQRYYRPEDISRQQAYKAASFYEVYASGGWGWGCVGGGGGGGQHAAA
jgi:hypothetical protein